MKEQLIEFETAKLAKERGFRIPCMYRFKQNIEETYVLGTATRKQLIDWNNGRAISVSTQSLLQKWLRDNYGIHPHIWYSTETEKWNVDLYKYEEDGGLLNNPMELSNYNSYEESLEQGLLKALKLIWILY